MFVAHKPVGYLLVPESAKVPSVSAPEKAEEDRPGFTTVLRSQEEKQGETVFAFLSKLSF